MWLYRANRGQLVQCHGKQRVFSSSDFLLGGFGRGRPPGVPQALISERGVEVAAPYIWGYYSTMEAVMQPAADRFPTPQAGVAPLKQMTKNRLLSRVASTDKMGIKNPATSIVAAFADKGGQRVLVVILIYYVYRDIISLKSTLLETRVVHLLLFRRYTDDVKNKRRFLK